MPRVESHSKWRRPESGVVNRLVTVITSHHDFHVVVQTGGGQTTQVLKRADVFSDRGGKVLPLHKPDILAVRVSQDITEGVHAARAFDGEGDLVGRVDHLRLHPLSRFKSLGGWFRQMRPDP